MARYKVGNMILDTDRAQSRWVNNEEFDGRNWVSVATLDQWSTETLYRSAKGRYWLERVRHEDGVAPVVSIIGKREAASWLYLNEYELPADLETFADDIAE